jgi:hydroxymethylpyrimidine/phosphomethylpyrimidine kinase
MNPSATHEYTRVLSIAGSDSGGGAGIQADLKTFAALGCFGMTAITAITAQNTTGVRAIHAPPADMLQQQIDAVVEDIGVHAVKIGMLHAADIVDVVHQSICKHSLKQVVLDPVMVATSGALLIQTSAVDALIQKLFPVVTLITPNLDEASHLVQRPLHTEDDMLSAAQQLRSMGAPAVLIKGGHLQSDVVSDLLLTDNNTPHWIRAPRVQTHNTHGTGCTLSSAIAAHLALGHPLLEAVQHAHAFIRLSLQAGAHVLTGHGSGPLNHGAAPQTMHLRPLHSPS